MVQIATYVIPLVVLLATGWFVDISRWGRRLELAAIYVVLLPLSCHVMVYGATAASLFADGVRPTEPQGYFYPQTGKFAGLALIFGGGVGGAITVTCLLCVFFLRSMLQMEKEELAG